MNQDNDDIFNDIDAEVNHFAEIFPDLNNSEHSDYYSINKFNENWVINVYNLNIIHCNINNNNNNKFYWNKITIQLAQ